MSIILLFCFAFQLTHCSPENNKGLNIDIDFNNSSPIANSKATPIGIYLFPLYSSTESLVDVKFPVPYVYISPNELENVHQIAEAALENESIKAGTQDIYQEVLKKLSNLTTEEMINDLIAKINKLEAIKAELGTEERIARLKLTNKNSTPSTSLPVSHPVAFSHN